MDNAKRYYDILEQLSLGIFKLIENKPQFDKHTHMWTTHNIWLL